MTDRINKRILGKILIFISLLVWLFDRLTHGISITLGKIIYGDLYVNHAEGIIDDHSCKFNIDMYLAYALFTLFLFGILLYIASIRETENIKIYYTK